MKLLVLKTDAILSADVRREITDLLHTGIKDGIIFLDGNYTYEVAEFDSINYDGKEINFYDKKNWRKLRRRFTKEVTSNENTKD